jgi:hypothetical protein
MLNIFQEALTMLHLRRSANVLSAWLVAVITMGCAALLLPVPAWAKIGRANDAPDRIRSGQLSELISDLSDSIAFDSLQSDLQQFAQAKPQESQPQQGLRRETLQPQESQPQQAVLRRETIQPQESQPQQAVLRRETIQPQQALMREKE